MTQNTKYLSDEELELLIADVEQNELVMAPPDLLEGILDYIDENADKQRMPENSAEKRPVQEGYAKPVNKIREFRRYYLKVCASVAAAVFLIFAIPATSNDMAENVPEREDLAGKGKYATKEEALNDESVMMQKLGGNNIFCKDREWGIFIGEGIFNGKNGG